MNIHPLFVHFPIALLALYSLLELASCASSRLREQEWVFSVKAFLLFVGVATAFIALVTGGITEDILKEEGDANFYMVGTHSAFAAATTVLYVILAAAYLVRVFDRRGWGNRMVGLNSPFMRIWNFKKYVAHLILDTWFLPILALLSFIGMAFTGALGAAIVYGPSADPFVSFVYHLFWAQ